jgi:hypothetical protein
MNIEILYKSSGNPVNGDDWDWGDCECNPTVPAGYTATISLSPVDNFEGDEKLKIHLRFKELNNVGDNQGDEIGLLLTVQIIDDLKIDSKKTHKEINDFAFDENNKKNYPFY